MPRGRLQLPDEGGVAGQMDTQPAAADRPVRTKRRPIWAWLLGVFCVAVIAVVALWDWDWFLPLVDAQASSALGRKVTAQHLHVSLGGTTTISLDGIEVAGTPELAGGKPFADIDRLTVALQVWPFIRSRLIVVPQITVDHPVIEADQDLQGQANWPTGNATPAPASNNPPPDPTSGPQIGNLAINNGQAHVALAKLKADLNLGISTKPAAGAAATAGRPPAGQADPGDDGQLVVDAKGTYAAQPITGQFVGGALLSLRDKAHPYPVDLHVANGPTRVALTGTVENPLNFAGADLRLQFSGPDMALLTPLTGVPIPQTPAFSIAGKLDYADHKVRFDDFHGRLGNSDLNGDIAVDPTRARPFVDADLTSHRVDLADLGGLIGTTPGRKNEANQSAAQKGRAGEAGGQRQDPAADPDQPAEAEFCRRAHALQRRAHRGALDPVR